MDSNLNDIKILLMESIWERIKGQGQCESAIKFGLHQGRISQIKNKKVNKFGITSLLLIANQVGLGLDVNVVEIKDGDCKQIDIFYN